MMNWNFKRTNHGAFTMRKFQQSLVLQSLLATTLLAATFGCTGGSGDEQTKESPAAKKVYLHTVSTMDLVDRRSYAADLDASTEITLYPLVAERIVSFPVEDGDKVEAGQVIARIRAAGIKKSIAQVEAELEALEKTLSSQKRELERSA